MQSGKWSIEFRALPGVAALTVFSLLLALGFWQLDRADQKSGLYELYLEKASLDPLDLSPDQLDAPASEQLLGRTGRAEGHYSGDQVFILDNQMLKGVPGYLVFSPFEIAPADTWILVNRGWVPAGYYREKVPDVTIPDDRLTLIGTIMPPPSAPAIALGVQAEEKMEKGIIRMQNVDLRSLENTLGHSLLPFVMQLDPESPAGYAREWLTPGSGAEKHMGYAFQWFALSAVLLVLYISASLRRQRDHE